MRPSKEQLTAVWASLLGGFIVAHLVVGKVSLLYLAYLTLTSGILLALWHLLVWGLRMMGRREFVSYARRFGDIGRLPLTEAKIEAEMMLESADKFTCVKAEREVPVDVSRLGEHASHLFAVYKEIRELGEESVFGWDQIGNSQYVDGFIRIGWGLERTEYVVRPGADGIFAFDSRQESAEGIGDPLYPTVYHLIIAMHEL